ncbi:MAG: hypothetical protein V4624_07530 [Pseudomonadota bacterium]
MSSSLVFTPPALDVLAAITTLQAQDDVVLTLPWRALAITGPDAETFLQGQLTTDMREVTPARSRLGCLLNLKGRVQISGRLLAWPDGYVLLLPEAQFEPARARLGKYGVFSKISLKELPLRIQGLLGQGALHRAASLGLALPTAPRIDADSKDADSQASSGDSLPLRIRLPGLARGLLLSSANEAPVLADTSATTAAAQQCWEAASIRAGEWTLDVAETELFQPQEMDYHALHGVSYQKGCYLGQEIVARLYFRGQLKTELSAWQAHATDADIKAGDALLDADGTRVGEVIRTAWSGSGAAVVLAQSKRDSAATQLQGASTLMTLTRLPFER